MGWHNPATSWREFERKLSGLPPAEQLTERPLVEDPLAGNDYPGRKWRSELPTPAFTPSESVVPYAELHCHSNFSFLDGASHPEELVYRAFALGLSGLALTDHDGFYGVVRFARAAAVCAIPAIYGAELSVDMTAPTQGVADPTGSHLVVLARNSAGYAALAAAISAGQLAGEKGRPVYQLEELAAVAGDNFRILTGCRKGLVRASLRQHGRRGARRELDRLVSLFGSDSVAVELIDHDQPIDDEVNEALATLAAEFALPTVATNNVHYHSVDRAQLATVLAAVRARRSLDEIDPWLPAAGVAHLRTGEEMARRFAGFPGAVARSVEFAQECAFDLKLIAPQLPPFDVPAGHDENSWLRELAMRQLPSRYPDERGEAMQRLEHELGLIKKLGFPGYFLIVHQIVEFCEKRNILCQGRGSAANSVVCFVLGVTHVDPIERELIFERFLAEERKEPPDIDIDIESDRREEVIQFVYRTYGRGYAAQVANVISYRPKSALRDVAKAFGFSPGQQDAWSKLIERGGKVKADDIKDENIEIPPRLIELTNELTKFPRHLGIHSGGMVICDRPIGEVCPVEWARMENRSVLQWDKDDCADAGLVKFDLLGLGMLSALHYAFDFIEEHYGEQLCLHGFGKCDDQQVYEMLCRADSIGVFQVESRAQMATLPRLKPKELYDLVVEVALIRPGPIQGNAVHPYIRRANKAEAVTYDHPKLKKALERTKGVPLFQEQLMQMAIDVAGFTAQQADQLRRAISRKRSEEEIEKLKKPFLQGAEKNDVPRDTAEVIFNKIRAFANFGFPESHALSFAHLAYVSSWLKRYYPAPFCAALLKAQPMGFYSPQTLVADARRHGVTVLGPDINASAVHATVAKIGTAKPTRAATAALPEHWGRTGPAVRVGLSQIRTVNVELAAAIVTERERNGPYRELAEVARRVHLSTDAMEALATAGVFASLGPTRRAALWSAALAAGERSDRLAGTSLPGRAPTLPGMTDFELAAADMWATGFSPDSHPIIFVRDFLVKANAIPISELQRIPRNTRIRIGGIVTHRQRPSTAGGITFLNLEDETAMVNIVCSPGLWRKYRKIARRSQALLVRGMLERSDDKVMNIIADHMEPLEIRLPTRSRDFQ